MKNTPEVSNRRFMMDPKLNKPVTFKPTKTLMKQPPIIARIQKQETPKPLDVNHVAKAGAALLKAAPKLAIRRIS